MAEDHNNTGNGARFNFRVPACVLSLHKVSEWVRVGPTPYGRQPQYLSITLHSLSFRLYPRKLYIQKLSFIGTDGAVV